ncbi:spore coat protein [Peribacillus simplex]|uniref:Spore coat protein F n=1 Tax=Peribacillus simplex TaxID=1478 RepID=A0A9W4KRJ6_9BACI|nr:spore coat protein [Peribacillus simplex]MDR4929431.1 spore coat protein [Peribacillus simplex]WHX90818.1 spore coat protein [Peribacillus simplex]CAH0192421.1 Spore coat protein F [Peribacillus simplex]
MKPTHSHLAWHETLELHEWVGAQSNALIIKDPILKTIYKQTIDTLTQNIMELLQFYPLTPKAGRDDASAAAAGELLSFAKSSIKSYALAITETATSSLRKVFKKHLNGAIDTHAKIFSYLYERNLYPAYDLNQLLQNDVDVANKALSQPF